MRLLTDFRESVLVCVISEMNIVVQRLHTCLRAVAKGFSPPETGRQGFSQMSEICLVG